MADFYQYTALPDTNSIRLIYLEPGAADSPLRCQLKTVSLDHLPAYEAISYAWGEPVFTCELCTDDDRMGITPSLYGALHRVRLESATRVLWADAVCINQENTDERSRQVALMRMIYSNATRVLIWLGPSSDEVPTAWKLVSKILAQRQRETELFRDVKTEAISAQRNEEMGLPAFESTEWVQLSSFYGRPYFQRAWVVQEVRLAREGLALCGEFQMAWDDLQNATRWLAHKMYFLKIDMTYMGGIGKTRSCNHGFFERQRAQNLLGLLRVTRNQATTDPRDKVYAILGIATEAIACRDSRLLPDYSKSMAQVYIDAVRYIIESSNDLKVLSMVQGSKRALDENHFLPTWVPRLDQPYGGLHIEFNENRIYKASNRMLQPVIPQVEENALVLRGIRFDLIGVDRIDRSAVSSDDRELYLQFNGQLFCDIWDSMGAKAHAYTEGWDRISAFYMTMTVGKTVPRTSASWDRTHWASISAYEKKLAHAAEASGREPSTRLQSWKEAINDLEGDPEALEYLMASLCMNRRVFTTYKGYLGLGPCDMRAGDVVCILFGGRVPYVLRDMGSHWQFIGECYVHGIMKGEAVDDFDGNVSNAEIFELR